MDSENDLEEFDNPEDHRSIADSACDVEPIQTYRIGGRTYFEAEMNSRINERRMMTMQTMMDRTGSTRPLFLRTTGTTAEDVWNFPNTEITDEQIELVQRTIDRQVTRFAHQNRLLTYRDNPSTPLPESQQFEFNLPQTRELDEAVTRDLNRFLNAAQGNGSIL